MRANELAIAWVEMTATGASFIHLVHLIHIASPHAANKVQRHRGSGGTEDLGIFIGHHNSSMTTCSTPYISVDLLLSTPLRPFDRVIDPRKTSFDSRVPIFSSPAAASLG